MQRIDERKSCLSYLTTLCSAIILTVYFHLTYQYRHLHHRYEAKWSQQFGDYSYIRVLRPTNLRECQNKLLFRYKQ